MTTDIANSDFLFPFLCRHRLQCNAENDIAARRCRECGTILVDPDDMRGAATTERRWYYGL